MKSILEAIARWIDARTMRIQDETKKPHVHEWELVESVTLLSKLNPTNKWVEYLYRCKGCCEAKTIKRD